jgi:hypothetical protein
MMRFRFLVLCVSYLAFFTLSCHKHTVDTAPTYVATISVAQPTEGQLVTRHQNLPVSITIERTNNQTIHNVLMEVLDNSDNVMNTIVNTHAHVNGKYSYENAAAHHAPTAGNFKLRITTTNDNKQEPNSKIVNFSVN